MTAKAEHMTEKANDVHKWVELVKQYQRPTELTAELLNALIEKIAVHEAIKHEDGSREQQIDIYWRFVGNVD